MKLTVIIISVLQFLIVLAPRHPESFSELAPLGRRGCVTTTTIVCRCHISTNEHSLSLGITHLYIGK
jgi:3-deoxy-D-manno-octulosonic-acid transferase